MTDTTLPILVSTRPAAAIANTDAFIVRQGADTEDRGALFSQILTGIRTFLYGTAGQGISIKEGSNARMGTATLVAGTVTVLNTSVTANTRIIPFLITLGTVTRPAALGNTARVAATSFTIVSSDVTDTSTIGYILIEPAP